MKGIFQLEKSHCECSELEQELRAKEQELEQLHQDSTIEKEKVYRFFDINMHMYMYM